MTPDKLFIGGVWRNPSARDPVASPWDGRVVFQAPRASATDVDDAIAAAVKAAPVMAKLAAFERRDLLRKIADGIAARREDLTRSIVAESGKPITATRAEVDRAIVTISLGAEEATRLEGEALDLAIEPRTRGWKAWISRVPVGPIAAITPFNFPLNLVAHKIAPAFAAGCPVVLKPAPQAPGAALILAEVIEAAGAPAGALSVVPCGAETAERLVTDPRVKMLSFTGSARVGWTLRAKAGRKKVALELGGNAGVAIAEDADLAYAAARCAAGGFVQAGQVCIKVQRIYVHASVAERFTALFLDEVRKLRAGDPHDPSTVIGPLIDEAAALRVESWIAEAVSGGAKVLLGGARQRALVPATVLSGAPRDAKVSCEEVFGPVVTIDAVKDFDEALARVDEGDWGLQAGVFTKDIDRIQRAFARLDVGTVVANEVPTFRVDSQPYGGVKGSGSGREGVRYAIEEMTERRALLLHSPE